MQLILPITVLSVSLLILVVLIVFVYRALRGLGFYEAFNDYFGVLGALISAPLSLVILFLVAWAALSTMLLGPFWLILAFCVIEWYRKHRASKQYGLLWLLTVSAERGVPITSALEAYARERPGSFAQRVRRLSKLLDEGVSLPDGLDRVRGLLPPHVPPMVRVGCQSGALAPALRRAAEVNNQNAPLWMSMVGKVAYVLMLAAFGISIILVVIWWLMPKFKNIFIDFDAEFPWMTEKLISFSDYCSNYWYVLWPFFMLLMLLMLNPLVRYFGWNLPGMGWITRRLDAADVLDGLSVVARQEMPMLDGLVALAQSTPRWNIRELLRRTAGDVEGGRGWAESLFARGLIRRADLAVLQAAERAGNLAWALQEVADSNRRRFAYRLQATVQTAFPIVIIGFGAIVGFVVIALFMPLIQLIQTLS